MACFGLYSPEGVAARLAVDFIQPLGLRQYTLPAIRIAGSDSAELAGGNPRQFNLRIGSHDSLLTGWLRRRVAPVDSLWNLPGGFATGGFLIIRSLWVNL